MLKHLHRDIGASLVVFLVALPLCLGIALACNVPPALGLVTGIVGGIVVGALAGSPLQVSGPAAGLVISVWVILDGWGLEGLGVAVLASGVLQLLFAVFKLGRWFRAVSPALITGMLAGIGVLISASQLHVMVGASPPGGGLKDILRIPGAWIEALGTSAGRNAAMVGVGTVVVLFLWDKFRPKALHVIPGPLLAVGGATLATALLSLDVAMVSLPDSLVDSLNVPSAESFKLLLEPAYVGAAAALGLIAAAESLLCANATDALHSGPQTNYDKELMALGVGNMVCGALGALPLTGVIVRSAANIEAGAQTRMAGIIHGFMLIGMVTLAPFVLAYIPIPALAGTLVFIGFKLASPAKAVALHKAGQGEVWVFIATVVAIVFTGLLMGIGIGLALAAAKLLYAFSHLELDVINEGDRYDVDAHGAATFVMLPKLAETLEKIPEDKEVHVHLGGLAYMDHACAELLQRQQDRRAEAGGVMVTEWDEVTRLRGRKPLVKERDEDASGPQIA